MSAEDSSPIPEADVTPEHSGAEFEATLQAIREALARKGISLTCPHCGGQRWDFLGFTIVSLSQDPQQFDFAIGRRAVALCCSHCGFYSAHDTEMLGLALDEEA
jgi:hypothetical protein